MRPNKTDILWLSKGLTGGFLPFGATVLTEDIYNDFLDDTRDKMFFHGHSYTANPLACSAAVASIELLQSRSCVEARERIANSHAVFAQRLEKHPRAENIRQVGTILALDFVNKCETSYSNPLRDLFYSYFLAPGVLLSPLGNIVYILPPYCITDQQLKEVYRVIESALDEVL